MNYILVIKEPLIINQIHYDDKEASKILLQKFFCVYSNITDTNYFEFLNTTKTDILKTLSVRRTKVSYLNEEMSEEDGATTELFTGNAKDEFFALITNITIEFIQSLYK